MNEYYHNCSKCELTGADLFANFTNASDMQSPHFTHSHWLKSQYAYILTTCIQNNICVSVCSHKFNFCNKFPSQNCKIGFLA